jgi:type II secretory pathway component PulC
VNIHHLKKSILGANALLTGLIVWMAATIFLGWNSEEHLDGSPGAEESVKSSPAERSAGRMMNIAAYQKIIQGDIFETAGAAPKPVPVSVPKAEEKIIPTQLNLRLKGTMLGDEASFAVIADGRTNQEKIYARNENVQNARITDILSDRVILEVNSRKEALILFPEKGDRKEEVKGNIPQKPPSTPPRPPTLQNTRINRIPKR